MRSPSLGAKGSALSSPKRLGSSKSLGMLTKGSGTPGWAELAEDLLPMGFQWFGYVWIVVWIAF